MSSGPQISGLAAGYVVNGSTTPFAGASLADASSATATMTIAFADPDDVNQPGGNDIVFSDPNAATDGSSYDVTTGVYSVSGTVAALSTVLQQLSVAAGGDGDDAFTLTVTDGALLSASMASYVGPLPLDTQVYGGDILLINQNDITFTLVDTDGAPDMVAREDIYGNEYTNLTLDNAQAIIETPATITLASGSSGDAATFKSISPWSSATGDDGAFTLDDASLAVYGADANVSFVGASDQVSFYSPTDDFYAEQASGDNAVVILNHVDLTLTGDKDTLYFEQGFNQLTLTAATLGGWSLLYGSSGAVTLAGASLSIIGGGLTVNGTTGANALSLYQTNGVDDTLTADDMSVTLNQAQAIVHGSGDIVWFAGGSSSTATLYANSTAPDTVYGAGVVALESGALSSIGGGALIEFLATGESATIAFTQGVWDRVEGDAGTTTVKNAQVVADGGNQIITFASGADDAASVYDTNGNWDSVYGVAQTLTVNSAQVNDFGGVDDVYLDGVGSALSLYDTAGVTEITQVFGSNATIDVHNFNPVYINGGDDTAFVSGTNVNYSTEVNFAATNGAWDTVYAQAQYLNLGAAQVSLFGGGDHVLASGAGEALSLYATDGVDDYVGGGGGAVTLNAAGANVEGNNTWCYFGVGYSGGALILNPSASGDTVTLTTGIGRDTVSNFTSNHTIAVSHAVFANFQALQAAFQQSGANATLTLDANDAVTFLDFDASSLSAAQVKIV